VSSFFTPTSQKPPEKIVWQERGVNDDTPATLIVGKYQPSPSSHISSESTRRKVAAFDFVSHTESPAYNAVLNLPLIGFYTHSNIFGQEVRL
jgi:hypothetical protein